MTHVADCRHNVVRGGYSTMDVRQRSDSSWRWTMNYKPGPLSSRQLAGRGVFIQLWYKPRTVCEGGNRLRLQTADVAARSRPQSGSTPIRAPASDGHQMTSLIARPLIGTIAISLLLCDIAIALLLIRSCGDRRQCVLWRWRVLRCTSSSPGLACFDCRHRLS